MNLQREKEKEQKKISANLIPKDSGHTHKSMQTVKSLTFWNIQCVHRLPETSLYYSSISLHYPIYPNDLVIVLFVPLFPSVPVQKSSLGPHSHYLSSSRLSSSELLEAKVFILHDSVMLFSQQCLFTVSLITICICNFIS